MSNEELAILIQEGHTELLSELWENTYKLLRMLAMRSYKLYAERLKAEPDDCIQESYFALLDAVKAYNPESGFMFNSYLNFSIRNRIRSLIGGQSDASLHSISLDEPIGDEDSETTRIDMLTDPDVNIESDVTETDYIRQLHNDLEVCLQRLQASERDIIKARYYNGQNISTIAAAYNMTIQEAQCIYKSGMNRLRDGKAQMKLRAYRNAVMSQYAYNGSFTSWRERQSSSTELTVLKLQEGLKTWHIT